MGVSALADNTTYYSELDLHAVTRERPGTTGVASYPAAKRLRKRRRKSMHWTTPLPLVSSSAMQVMRSGIENSQFTISAHLKSKCKIELATYEREVPEYSSRLICLEVVPTPRRY